MTEETRDQEGTVKVPCEVYSRVVGYIRPTDSWNKAKQLEFEERKTFDIGEKADEAD